MRKSSLDCKRWGRGKAVAMAAVACATLTFGCDRLREAFEDAAQTAGHPRVRDDVPVLLAPANGATVTTPRPVLRWKVERAEATVTVDICGDASCGTVALSFSGANETATPPRDLAAGTYFWRVSLHDGVVRSSAIWRFTVAGDGTGEAGGSGGTGGVGGVGGVGGTGGVGGAGGTGAVGGTGGTGGSGGSTAATFRATAGGLNVNRSAHAAARLLDGRVLIVGGLRPDGSIVADAELYDPATDTWSRTSPPGLLIHHLDATTLADGRVLVTGGNIVDDAVDATEIFDPATMAFTAGPRMVQARTRHTATLLLDGRVLVVGGVGPNGNSDFVHSAEIYDPASNSFALVSTDVVTRANHQATRLADGRVLVSGGNTIDGPLFSTEIFDPASTTFSPGQHMIATRTNHRAALLADGRVLVTGGLGDNAVVLSSAELYDPATNTFTPGGDSAPRENHQETVLADGRVLLTGGDDGGGPLSSTDIFDPASMTFSAGPGMLAARASHTATLLASGRVVMAGGGAASSVSAELFIPAGR